MTNRQTRLQDHSSQFGRTSKPGTPWIPEHRQTVNCSAPVSRDPVTRICSVGRKIRSLCSRGAGASAAPAGLQTLTACPPCPEGACCQPGRDSFIGRQACWKDCGLFTVLRPWLCKETVHINPHDGSVITSLNSWWTRGRPGNNTPFPRFVRPWDTLNTLYLWPALARCGQENAAFATIV